MSMKGQLVFEFVIAAMILFSIVIYSVSYSVGTVNAFHRGFVSDSLQSWALKVSDTLLNDPANGIVSEWPDISISGMSALQSECSNDYDSVLERFGLARRSSFDRPLHIYVTVEDEGGSGIMTCGDFPPPSLEKATVTRFGRLPSDTFARVEVTIW
jgi:hypothetical protein